MSLKKLFGVSAWVLVSGLFFTGPILLSEGILPGWAGLPISLIPCLAFILVLFSTAKTPEGKSVMLAAASVVVYVFNHLDLLEPESIFLANFTVINGLLFWMFVRTLRSDSIPLCTRFADMVHETMSPDVVAYTRVLTLVWAVFFAIQVVLWTALFFLIPHPIWLKLIAIAPPLLIVILFGLDWISRQLLLPEEDKKDALKQTIRAIIRHRHAMGKTILK